jgi:hypothetical protein
MKSVWATFGVWAAITALFLYIGRNLPPVLTHWMNLTPAVAWASVAIFSALISLVPAAETYRIFRPRRRH